MTTLSHWLGYLAIAGSMSTVIGMVIYTWCRDPDEIRYCAACKQQTPWHPDNGCTLCHSADQIF